MASDLVIYETMPGSAPTLTRPLTHHLELADRGLAVNATQNEEWRPVPGHEGHICPLQLGFIERCVRLWSNPGEIVLTPFAGIGSELYQSVKLGRRAVGIELKRSYWETAVTNLTELERELSVPALFDEAQA